MSNQKEYRYYTFLSEMSEGNGHIPESVFSLETARETAKEWQKVLGGDILIISYPWGEGLDSLSQAAKANKIVFEEVVKQDCILPVQNDNTIHINGIKYGYLFNGFKPTSIVIGRV